MVKGFEELIYLPDNFNPSPMWQDMVKKGLSKIYDGHTVVSYHYSDEGILVLGVHRFDEEEGTGTLPLGALKDLKRLWVSQDKVIVLTDKAEGPVRKWMDRNKSSYVPEHKIYIKEM